MKSIQQLRTALRPLALAFAAAGAVAALAGCSDATGKAAQAQAAAAPQAAPVSAAVVVQKPVAETQEFSGRLEAIEHVEIRPRVSGYITQVAFTPGAEVKKGQLLFVIDPRPYQAEADRAEAAARAARAKSDLAKVELNRAERLLGD